MMDCRDPRVKAFEEGYDACTMNAIPIMLMLMFLAFLVGVIVGGLVL